MKHRFNKIQAGLKKQAGFLLNPFRFGGDAAAPSDAYFDQVALLLHGDTAVDSSIIPKTLTAVGNAVISTAQKRFGAASMLFDGNNDAYTAPSSTDWDFGAGDFTIECSVYPTSNPVANKGLIVRDAIGGTRGWLLFLADGTSGTVNGAPVFAAWNGATTWKVENTTPAPLNTWTDIAVTRTAGILRLFVNGVLIATNSANLALAIGAPAVPLCVGSLYATAGLLANCSTYGHIDEVRITKGVSRYTAAYTVATLAFPDL